jgi:hypothetical protein
MMRKKRWRVNIYGAERNANEEYREGRHGSGKSGIEYIPGKFFRAMLEHDGLPIPAWDREEVDAVRKDLNCVPWQPQE